MYPACSWILSPSRKFSRSQALYYAVAFLGGLAAIKTGLEYWERGPNHYSVLGVFRDSPAIDVKKAYKRLSLTHHPDKGGDPGMFQTVKASYDVLMSLDDRVVYNKFGAEGLRVNKSIHDETQL